MLFHHIPVLLLITDHVSLQSQTEEPDRQSQRSFFCYFFFPAAFQDRVIQIPMLPKLFLAEGQSRRTDFHSQKRDARGYEVYFRLNVMPSPIYEHENQISHLFQS